MIQSGYPEQLWTNLPSNFGFQRLEILYAELLFEIWFLLCSFFFQFCSTCPICSSLDLILNNWKNQLHSLWSIPFFGFLLFYGENVLLICIRKYRKRFLIQPKMLIWSETNSVVLLSKRFWKTDDLLISHKYFQIPNFVLRFLWKASFGLDSFESVSRYINISVELYHRAITTIVSMEGAAFNFGFVSGCKQRILFIYTSLCVFMEFSLETLTREWESLTSLLCRKVTNILCSWAR